jgi:hypothetical protein
MKKRQGVLFFICPYLFTLCTLLVYQFCTTVIYFKKRGRLKSISRILLFQTVINLDQGSLLSVFATYPFTCFFTKAKAEHFCDELLGFASNGAYLAIFVTKNAVVSYTTFSPLPQNRAVYFLRCYPSPVTKCLVVNQRYFL